MTIYRLTGTAEAVVERSGVKNKGTEDEWAWTMREQPIRLDSFAVTPIPVESAADAYPVGQQVDLIVDVSARGGYLNVRVLGEWPKSSALHAAKSA